MKKNVNKIRWSKADMAYNVINVTILGLLMLLVLYPLYFVVIASISDPSAVGTGQVLFWPSGLNFDGYQRIFEYEMIWVGYRNSIIYAITGSFLSVSLTMTAGYVFTRNRMPGRKFFLALYTIPMFFNGGLIPTYLVVQGPLNFDQVAEEPASITSAAEALAVAKEVTQNVVSSYERVIDRVSLRYYVEQDRDRLLLKPCWEVAIRQKDVVLYSGEVRDEYVYVVVDALTGKEK